MSQRVSRSPYTRKRQTSNARKTAGVQQQPSHRTQQAGREETILYQREAPNDQLNQVAATVTAQLIPEIRGHIMEAVNSFRNSLSTVASPDSANQPAQ